MSGAFRPVAACVLLAVAVSPATAVDYDDVADVLRLRCAGCHHAGGPAPFALENFEQARAWASSIRRAVASGAMPPWHADPRYGEFANDRRLTATEKSKLLAWVDGGSRPGSAARVKAPAEQTGSAPREAVAAERPESAAREASATERPGSIPQEAVATRQAAAEPPASSSPAAAARAGSGRGWSIGVPDLVFELPEEVTVPATGEVPYHGYRVETGLAEDVWIQAAETRPGNPAVVHHIIVQAFPGAGAGAAPASAGGDPRTAGDLGGYAPGTGPLTMPPGVGRRLPAGAVLDFQMHYTPTGRVETDRSRIGLVLAAEPPRHESRTALCSTPFLWIPAGEKDVRFEAELTFPRATRVLSLRPHMHLRGDTFEFRAEYPDGRSEILLLVTGYDFDWQTTYRFAEPMPLPAGTRLRCTAAYDNSGGNPRNPDPTRDVSWGRETTDEMMIGFVDYYEVE